MQTAWTASPEWRDHALLLAAHGDDSRGDASRLLHAHADTLRSADIFAEVAVGLLHGGPSPAEACGRLRANVVHVVPFFMERGWFVRSALPAALGDAGGRTLRHHRPIGSHPALAGIAAARLHRARPDDAACFVLLLIAHGSSSAPGRRLSVHAHAERLRAMRIAAAVDVACLAEPPLVADALRSHRNAPLAVLHFLAGEGSHVRVDLAALLSTEQAARTTAPLLELGLIVNDPAMPQIILDLVAQADGGDLP